MNDEQQLELRVLLETLTAQGDITNEHLFQAALSLSRELSELVRGYARPYAPMCSFSFMPSRAGVMTINSAPLPMP